jgi:hypothetical protein
MLSHIVRTIAALSLMLSATPSVAGSLPDARGHKCNKSHHHAKRVVPKAAPRGAGLVEQRRSPDVQILSFGP